MGLKHLTTVKITFNIFVRFLAYLNNYRGLYKFKDLTSVKKRFNIEEK